MKQPALAVAIVFIALFTACSGGNKKVMIMASGKVTVDEKDPKSIRLDPGTTHNEKEITLSGTGKETLTVQAPDGNKTYDLSENGNYVLNLKPDTLVGGIVRYGTGDRTSNLTSEDVDNIIDSTRKLMAGQNASDAGKTYFIAPFTLKMLSTNENAKIIGPYNGIPGSIDAGDSKTGPEVYKLFTNKQKRQSLEELETQRKKS